MIVKEGGIASLVDICWFSICPTYVNILYIFLVGEKDHEASNNSKIQARHHMLCRKYMAIKYILQKWFNWTESQDVTGCYLLRNVDWTSLNPLIFQAFYHGKMWVQTFFSSLLPHIFGPLAHSNPPATKTSGNPMSLGIPCKDPCQRMCWQPWGRETSFCDICVAENIGKTHTVVISNKYHAKFIFW